MRFDPVSGKGHAGSTVAGARVWWGVRVLSEFPIHAAISNAHACFATPPLCADTIASVLFSLSNSVSLSCAGGRGYSTMNGEAPAAFSPRTHQRHPDNLGVAMCALVCGVLLAVDADGTQPPSVPPGEHPAPGPPVQHIQATRGGAALHCSCHRHCAAAGCAAF
jgi:hypothetical protein